MTRPLVNLKFSWLKKLNVGKTFKSSIVQKTIVFKILNFFSDVVTPSCIDSIQSVFCFLLGKIVDSLRQQQQRNKQNSEMVRIVDFIYSVHVCIYIYIYIYISYIHVYVCIQRKTDVKIF